MDFPDFFPTSPDPVLTTPSWCLWHQENGQAVPTMQGTCALLVHCMHVYVFYSALIPNMGYADLESTRWLHT
jgi:hypothetical protein